MKGFLLASTSLLAMQAVLLPMSIGGRAHGN